ncbi:MAG: cytochrome c oxidase assembly protein [Acetobacteraceae bacterium]
MTTLAMPRTERAAVGWTIGAVLIVLVGAGVAWFSATFPADMPSWGPWQFSWVEYLASALGLLWYARGVARLAPTERPSPWRIGCYATGVVGMYIMVQTRFTYIALHLFMATQGQQFVLHDIGPFLVALSWPGAALAAGMPRPLLRICRARPVLAVVRAVQQPVFATVLFVVLLIGQVVPVVLLWVMLDWRLFDAMNVLMAVEGLFFWCLVLDPRPKPPAPIAFSTRMIIAFLAMLPVIPIGAYITFTGRDLYSYYTLCGRLYPLISASYDQLVGGIIIWIPGSFIGSVAVLLSLNLMRRVEDRRDRVQKTYVQVGRLRVDPSAWTGR